MHIDADGRFSLLSPPQVPGASSTARFPSPPPPAPEMLEGDSSLRLHGTSGVDTCRAPVMGVLEPKSPSLSQGLPWGQR